MKTLEMLRTWKDLEEYGAGTVIFTEKDPAEVMYIILSGEVELTLHGELLGVEKKGGLIGEMAMINASVRNCTATARNKVKMARLDHEQFKRLVSEHPEFSLHAMSVLANRLRAVDNFIGERLVKSE